MHRCRHFVLIRAFANATRPLGVGFGAGFTCTRTLFNSLVPVITSREASPLVIGVQRRSFAVYRLADAFRFATSITAHCEDWPVADIRRMLSGEIDVVQRLAFGHPSEEHLEIALDLPHLSAIAVTFRSLNLNLVSCAPLVRMFQQTSSRALRRSIALTIRCERMNFSDLELFAPLMLEALLGAETADEFHDLLMLAVTAPGFPRQHEVDQYMSLLSDYKNNFTASTDYLAPLCVYIANAAVALHVRQAVPFDFEPFFDYIWNRYYATELLDEILVDRQRWHEFDGIFDMQFDAPYDIRVALIIVKNLFDGITMDVTDASRGGVCFTAFFQSTVHWNLQGLFGDEQFCNAVVGSARALDEYDDRIVELCCMSFSFASTMSNFVALLYDWCEGIQCWADERAAHTTRLIHRQGVDRATAERTVDGEYGVWNAIYDARLVAATLMFGCTDLQNPPRSAVEATQKLLCELFDEDNDRDDARLILAFTAVLKAIFLMPPDEVRDDNGVLVSTTSVLEQHRVKQLFTFLTHAARRERMRIKPETVPKADDSNKDRRRSREQSEGESNSNCSYRRYLPRLLEDNHLRQSMEQEAAQGTLVVKALLDELVSVEVIEI